MKSKWIEKSGKGTHYLRVPMVMFVALVLVVIGLTIMLWSAERGRKTHLSVKNPGDFSALAHAWTITPVLLRPH